MTKSGHTAFKLLLTVILLLNVVVSIGFNTNKNPSKHKQVLIVSSYGSGYAWSDELMSNLASELTLLNKGYEIILEHLSSEYNYNSANWIYRFNIITSVYKDYPPHFMVLLGDEAWYAFRNSIKRPSFSKTKIIVVAPKEFSISRARLESGDTLTTADMESTERVIKEFNATGVIRRINFDGYFDAIKEMVTPLKNIYILNDSRFLGYYTRIVADSILKRRGDLEPIFLSKVDISTDSLIKMSATFKDSSAIFITSWMSDGLGYNYALNHTYTKLSEKSKLPIFGIMNKAVERGLFVGGFFMSPSFWSERAARLIVEADKANSAADIPVEIYTDTILYVNKDILKRYKISKESVPVNTKLLSIKDEFMAKHRVTILVIFGVLFIIIIVFIVALRSLILMHKSRKQLLETEKSLQRALNMSRESDRLKSAFLANMSHEIRTPLNSILGFSELIIESEDVEERERYHKIISTNSDLLLRLIDDILDLSKIEAGTYEFIFEEVEICALVNELKEMFEKEYKIGVEFIVDNRFEKYVIMADRKRLMQVFVNLLSNAFKFTTKGYVKLTLNQDEFDGEWLAVITIEDTGIGISQDQLGEIFGRFVKLNDFIDGTGLGLTICQTIIEKHNGTIDVKSELGKGTTFTVRIPHRPLYISS